MLPRHRLAFAIAVAALAGCSPPPPAPAVPAPRVAVAPVESPPEAPPAPSSTAAPSAEPAVPAPATPPRVVVTCNDCGMKQISMIHFPYGSAAVSAQARPLLRDVVEVMKTHPDITLVAVEGHADLDEGRSLVGDISRSRAEAVRDHLVASGVEAGRLVVVAHGNTRPLADNGTVAGRAHNRRVEFRVEEKKEP